MLKLKIRKVEIHIMRLSAAFVSVSVIVTPPAVAPWSVICFAVEIPLDHEQEPLGMMTVSPSFAEFIALSTSLTLQDAAVKVLAFASPPNNVPSTSANKTHFMIFVIAKYLSNEPTLSGLSLPILPRNPN